MLKVMSIMAHQDDFEFNAGGLFAKLRDAHGENVKLKILTTTKGASGHHELGLEETFRRREHEAENSAAVVGAEYECLTCLDGSHLSGQVFIDRNMLGGLWNAIRTFNPDYIFCPPVISDPLAGIHIDHYNTAWAVRMLGYQLTVPHAYPTIGKEPEQKMTNPVIINVDDSYASTSGFDLALEITDVFDKKLQMALCHESQIYEWLPWNSGESGKVTADNFRKKFEERHHSINKRYGISDQVPREYFKVTHWGKGACKQKIDNSLRIGFEFA